MPPFMRNDLSPLIESRRAWPLALSVFGSLNLVLDLFRSLYLCFYLLFLYLPLTFLSACFTRSPCSLAC